MKNNKGFTLIELLVVVAIIGLLASIVLASLVSARAKANDSEVKSQLLSLRDAIEIYYSVHNGYGTTTTSCSGGMFSDTTIAPLLNANRYPSGTNLDCGVSGSNWSVAASLNGGTSTAGPVWCIDSTTYSSDQSKSHPGSPYSGVQGNGGSTAAHWNIGDPACR